MWLGKEGMMMNGTNGVQLWDTAFTVSAVFEADLAGDKEFIPVLTKALEFLEDMQVSIPSLLVFQRTLPPPPGCQY